MQLEADLTGRTLIIFYKNLIIMKIKLCITCFGFVTVASN